MMWLPYNNLPNNLQHFLHEEDSFFQYFIQSTLIDSKFDILKLSTELFANIPTDTFYGITFKEIANNCFMLYNNVLSLKKDFEFNEFIMQEYKNYPELCNFLIEWHSYNN